MNRLTYIVVFMVLGSGVRGLAMEKNADQEMNNILTKQDGKKFELDKVSYKKKKVLLQRGAIAVTVGATVLALGSLACKRSILYRSASATWAELGLRSFALFSLGGCLGGLSTLGSLYCMKQELWCKRQKLLCDLHEEIKNTLEEKEKPITLKNKLELIKELGRKSWDAEYEQRRLYGLDKLKSIFEHK